MRTKAIVLILLVLAGCHHAPATLQGGSTKDPDQQVYVGLATYGDLIDPPIQNADGTLAAAPLYTAAHHTLPTGTRIMVTNLQNNRSLEVTVTHRGPERKEFILQMNLTAAKELDMLSGGPVQVRFEVIHGQ
jgi:rare lipoprotein A